MADRGDAVSFFRGIYVRIDITIDIFIFIRHGSYKNGDINCYINSYMFQIHQQELIELRLIKKLMVTLGRIVTYLGMFQSLKLNDFLIT